VTGTAGRKLSWSDLRGARAGVWGLGREGMANIRKLRALGVEPVLVDDRPEAVAINGWPVLATGSGGLAALSAASAPARAAASAASEAPELGRAIAGLPGSSPLTAEGETSAPALRREASTGADPALGRAAGVVPFRTTARATPAPRMRRPIRACAGREDQSEERRRGLRFRAAGFLDACRRGVEAFCTGITIRRAAARYKRPRCPTPQRASVRRRLSARTDIASISPQRKPGL